MKPCPLNSLGTQKLGTCYITVTKGSSQRPSRAQSQSVLNLLLGAWSYVQDPKKVSRSAEQMHVGAEQRSDASKRQFMLSQTGLSIIPLPSSFLPLEPPSTCQRTDCSSTQASTPTASVEESFFFLLQLCVMSRAEHSPIMPSVIIFTAQGLKEWEVGRGRKRRRGKRRGVEGRRSQGWWGWGLRVNRRNTWLKWEPS